MFFLNYFFNIYFMVIVYNDNRTWYENWQKYGTIKLSLQGKNDNEYRWHCYTCIYFIHLSTVILPCLLASCYCSCPCQHGDCMTSCSVIVKRSMSKCLHLSLCLLTYCHSISVSDIYNKDTSSSSFWTSLSTAHKNSYCQSFISFFIFPRRCQNFTVYCEVPLRYLHFYCRCLLYTYLYCHNMTVYCMLSSILHCSFYTSMNKSILSTAYKISLLKLHSLLPNSIVKTLMSNALHRRWDFTSWYPLPTSIQLLKPSLSVAFCHCQNLTVCRMLLSCHYISLSTATNTP